MMKSQFIIYLFISSVLFSQSASDILTKVQTKFRDINNFSATINQTYNKTQSQTGNKMTGKFLYKKKNKFNVEFGVTNIISDGETIWNYNKSSKHVVISNLQEDPTSFSLERFVFDYPSQCVMKLIKNNEAKNGDELLELIPNNQKLQFKKARILVSSDGMISKLEITDFTDVQYIFQFSDIKIDLDLPGTKFTYIPPKGIKIIDLR